MLSNRELLAKISNELDELLEDIVFVGSITLEYLIDEKIKTAISLRTTEDVDIVIQVSTKKGFYDFLEKLREKGFGEDIQSPTICTMKKGELKIDIMPTKQEILGFTNRWYAKGVKNTEKIKLANGKTINILKAPFFLASKIEAFFSRGIKDPFLSKDLEDILDLINGRGVIVQDVSLTNDLELINFLSGKINQMLEDERTYEAISGHFYGQEERFVVVIKRMKRIVEIGKKYNGF